MITPDDEFDSSDGAERVVVIPDPVSVRELIAKLQVPAHSVIATLLEFNMFTSMSTELDFTTAAAICSQYGVVARPIS